MAQNQSIQLNLGPFPWLGSTTEVALHHTIYNTFKRANSNYDGFGRSAADNNTLYAKVQSAF